jgi:gluconokinase
VDADDLHPRANVEKMAAGHPLTDADRAPWFARVGEVLRNALAEGTPVVLACSALKARYRHGLGLEDPRILTVSLEGSPQLLAERLAHRHHAYMPPDLLPSQLATFEPPAHALRVDVAHPVEALVKRIVQALGASVPEEARDDRR